MAENDSNIVVDDGKNRISDLWTKEDYWAIWLGFIILIAGMCIYLSNPSPEFAQKVDKANAIMQAEAAKSPFKTIEYYQAQDAKSSLKALNSPIGKSIKHFMGKPSGWTNNPISSFVLSQEEADARNAAAKPAYDKAKAANAAAYAEAQLAQTAAAAAGYQIADLNTVAQEQIAEWRATKKQESAAKKKASTKPYNIFTTLPFLIVAMGIFFSIGMKFMGHNVGQFFIGFVGVAIVSVLAMMMGSQSTMKYWGLGTEPWAIILGMLIANTIGTPKFMKPALQVEYYIKTGLVLLGAEVLFNKIIAIGIPGIFVAWVVTPIVLISTFIFGQKVLKMPSKTLNITISADMSVCGTSAAIAAAAACRAKKEELTLSVGLSLVFTAIMMVVMPAVIKALGLPEVLGGAWMGGTIDATGAVAAAGAFLGEKALYVAATIKMIQNVLIGVCAFGIAVYWCARVENNSGKSVGWIEIWNRFPKFVIGFLTASVIFSFIAGNLGSDMTAILINQGVIKGFSGGFRGWFFCLAFTAIGLATNFRELAHYFKGGKPLILYACGQSFNLALTLAMAYVMFYLVFPEITAKI